MEWKLQAHSPKCHGCGEDFADEQRYFTILKEEEAELNRLDLCSNCRNSRADLTTEESAKFVSKWTGAHKLPPPKSEEPIEKATAETVLKQLVEENDPGKVGSRYILAAMLERKRKLRLRDTIQRDSRRVFVYEFPKTKEALTIEDIEIPPQDLERVTLDVCELLAATEHGVEGTEKDDDGTQKLENTPSPDGTN